jgi:hypothetical protein
MLLLVCFDRCAEDRTPDQCSQPSPRGKGEDAVLKHIAGALRLDKPRVLQYC